MSNLKEITAYDKSNKEIKLSSKDCTETVDKIYKVHLVDVNNKPYVFRRFQSEVPDSLDPIACETLSVDLSDIQDMFKTLTVDQKTISMHIYYSYKNMKISNESGEMSEDNPKIIIQGPAGSGKTTIINFIEKLITWEENKSSDSSQKVKVLKCALTGKAASNIDGSTLHHTFSISIYKSKKPSTKCPKKEELKNCTLFVCDEISMVGKRMMGKVNTRLQQIFQNKETYGNRFVLLVGDLCQIDPVKDTALYKPPPSKYWKCCEFYELTKILRQEDENFIKALNNFRDNKMTKEDIDLLKLREIRNVEHVPGEVIHLFYQNKHVNEYNIGKLNKTPGKEVVVDAIEHFEEWPTELRVKIGIRYMITYNIDTGDSLANGTTGFVRDFDYDDNGDIDIIWMEFYSLKIGKKARINYLNNPKYNRSEEEIKNWVPIQRVEKMSGMKHPKMCDVFTLRCAEGITVHKSQGQTYHDGVCIRLVDKKLRTNKSLLYVALTRVVRLDHLYIHGELDYSKIKSKKFADMQSELNRLRRERKLKVAYETFEDKPEDVIVYLNTESTFNDHYEFITTDSWYENASLLVFTETKTIASSQIDIPNFEIAFPLNEEEKLKSGGEIICYKKADKSLKVLSRENDSGIFYVTILFYENFLHIISTVIRNQNDDVIKYITKKFISSHIKKLILFFGDIEITPNLDAFFNSCNLKKVLTCSTNKEGKSDVVFTLNVEISGVGFYEYIPTSHKPIYVKLPKSESKSEAMETN